MSETAVFTFECAPGTATPELALDCQRRVIALLNAIADDIAPGAVVFTPHRLEWIDDGKDEIVIRVTT